MKLVGNTAIVTGGSRGIGYAVADYLMGHGADVVITARGGDALQKAADDLTGRHEGRAIPVACDAASAEQVAALFDEAAYELGDIWIVVNNAGNSTLDTIENLSESDWDSVLGVHLKGTFLCTQQALKHMRNRKIKGVVINTSSVESFSTTRGNAHYSAAKAGIDKFTEVAALEAGRLGIRVNCVAPGAVATSIGQDVITPEFNDAWDATFSIERMGEPADIAKAVTFLASDYADWITGVTLLVDGGSHLRGIPDYVKYLLPDADLA